MTGYFRELTNRMILDFGETAREFLETGLTVFHSRLDRDRSSAQVVVMNLGSAVEFMFRSFLAARNPGLLFRNIPPDLRVLITVPDQLPSLFQWRRFDFDLQSGRYEMIDFDECAACYYLFFPELKQILHPNLTTLSSLMKLGRNTTLPPVNSYDLERIVYSVLQVGVSLHGNDDFDVPAYTMSSRDEDFFRSYNTKRIERVELALAQAREGGNEADSDHAETVIAYNWDTCVTPCPVCLSNGLLDGYTETAVGSDGEDIKPELDFFATRFQCDECGLILNDSEEMKLAKMNTIYDRSEELDKWFEEHGVSSGWNL